jgi:hypothetical protein
MRICGVDPSSEIAAPTNKVPETVGNLPRFIPTRDLQVAFKISHSHNFVPKLWRQKAKVTQRNEIANFCNIGQGEAQHREYKRPKMVAV